jgi:hypothetical protein
MKLLSLLRKNPKLMTSMLEVAWNPEDRKKLSEIFMFTVFGSWKNPSEGLICFFNTWRITTIKLH